MIPTVIDYSKEIQEFTIQDNASMPTLTYRMDLKNNRVQNWVDGQEAMKQVAFKCLQTERYQHKIYSSNHGLETLDLYGMPKVFVIAELERRIRETLLWDERFLSVTNFTFEDGKKGSIYVQFECDTIFGKIKINEFEVNF